MEVMPNIPPVQAYTSQAKGPKLHIPPLKQL